MTEEDFGRHVSIGKSCVDSFCFTMNDRKKNERKKTREGISIHTNQAEKNILTTGDRIK